jgi:hypothetical protein
MVKKPYRVMTRFGIGAKRQKVGRGQQRFFPKITVLTARFHHRNESMPPTDSNN